MSSNDDAKKLNWLARGVEAALGDGKGVNSVRVDLLPDEARSLVAVIDAQNHVISITGAAARDIDIYKGAGQGDWATNRDPANVLFAADGPPPVKSGK